MSESFTTALVVKTRDEALAGAREACNSWFGDTPYDMDVSVDPYLRSAMRVISWRVCVTAHPHDPPVERPCSYELPPERPIKMKAENCR